MNENKIKYGLVLLYLMYPVFLLYQYGLNCLWFSYVSLYTLLVLLTVEDIKKKTISLDVMVVFGLIAALTMPFNPNVNVMWTVIATLLTGLILYIINRLTNGGIGVGDIIMICICMLFIGWEKGLLLLILALMMSGFVSICLLILRKVNRKTEIPFVPFILLAFLMITIII